MNLCVRREAHDFIGGFPDGELFHMDMEVSESIPHRTLQ